MAGREFSYTELHSHGYLEVARTASGAACKGVHMSMNEYRIHGRGGQGAVVASELLAFALFREGRFVQAFPAFGVERRCAPVTAFLRVSNDPILLRCEITEPEGLIILDPTLIESVDVTAGLRDHGSILINSAHRPEHYGELLRRFHVATVDASGIAMRHGLGSKTQPIVNTAILGAFAVDTDIVKLESICEAITEKVPFNPAVNVLAAREAAKDLVKPQRLEVQHV
jgi:pyruvate ferredoxin oxidoreductase gamma subunit/2-oxoisovalerate ferredoxin oxidoreductase gamma subunit